MKRLKHTVCFLVTLTGIAVLAAWEFGWEGLKSIQPHWITMKVASAMCFTMSGVLLFLLRSNGIGKKSEALCSALTFGIMGLVLSLMYGELFKVSTGVERVFVPSQPIEFRGSSGTPAVTSLIAFSFIAASGVAWIFNKRRWIKPCYIGVGIIGALGLVGYLTHWSWLYGEWDGTFKPMAFHSAVLFVLLGICGADKITLGKSKGH